MRNLALLAPLVAVPLLLVSNQDPPAEDPPEQDPPQEVPEVETWEELRARQNEETMELLEGCWILQQFHSIHTVVPREDVRGFLLIADGYLSIVVHARTPITGQEVYRVDSQANFSQFELTTSGSTNILAATLIGHSNFSGTLQHEPGNLPRQFMVEVHEHDLILRRVDGSSLQFRRLQSGGFTEAARERLEERRSYGGF